MPNYRRDADAIGNPSVWWLAAAAPTCFLAWATTRLLAPSATNAAQYAFLPPAAKVEAEADTAASKRHLVNGALLFLGYLANWLPFVAVERAAFLYHFLPSLIHALLLAGVMLDVVVPPVPLLRGRVPLDERLAGTVDDSLPGLAADAAHAPDSLRWLVAGALIYVMAACFAFFAPLAYGIPLRHEEFEARMWLDSWR